jgi:hypothetical protein
MPFFYTPSWSIDTFDPVSIIKRFGSPSISIEIVGEPCSNKIETVALLTAFSSGKRWRELPSLSPLIRFPGSGFAGFLPVS